jgi:uncharacterized membrane protein
VDFRDLNRATPKDEYPMPVAETLINAATGHKILSFMDGNAGYNPIFMAPEDINKTAFRVPGAVGLFEYMVMTFGYDFWVEECWRYVSACHELHFSRVDRQAGANLY